MAGRSEERLGRAVWFPRGMIGFPELTRDRPAENGKAVLSRFPTVEDLMCAVEEEGRGGRRGSR